LTDKFGNELIQLRELKCVCGELKSDVPKDLPIKRATNLGSVHDLQRQVLLYGLTKTNFNTVNLTCYLRDQFTIQFIYSYLRNNFKFNVLLRAILATKKKKLDKKKEI
jgi:hypothetical protein